MSGPDADDGRIPGVVTVTERAMRRLFSALAAEELGVDAKDVDVRVRDARGGLAVQLAGPIRVPRLGVTRRAGVLETAGAARSRVVGDGQRLTGAVIDTVGVRITGARIESVRRVS